MEEYFLETGIEWLNRINDGRAKIISAAMYRVYSDPIGEHCSGIRAYIFELKEDIGVNFTVFPTSDPYVPDTIPMPQKIQIGELYFADSKYLYDEKMDRFVDLSIWESPTVMVSI
jgi:hypothetical protein